MDRWVSCPPAGSGVRKEGSEKLREVGSQMGSQPGGELLVLCESRTVVPLLTTAASAPWRPSRAGAGMLHIRALDALRSAHISPAVS